MSAAGRRDAVVVGAGPNGLAAAILLAENGHSVLVLEAKDTIGGGCRSAELTLPGFIHDVCSAIHPFALSSPFLSRLPLNRYGLRFIQPPAPLAHPFDDGTAVTLERSLGETARGLGGDGQAYGRLMKPLVAQWVRLAEQVLGPPRIPTHPLLLARFGVNAIRPARGLAEGAFRGERARALFAGLAAHSILPLERPLTSAFGLLLGASGHAVGWPAARSGSQSIVDAMAAHLRSLGGEIVTERHVSSMGDLPPARAILFDVDPGQLLAIAGDRLPDPYARSLERFEHGPGVFKLDVALDGPIPWKAGACTRAGTVHAGGTLSEIAASESGLQAGRIPERPFVLVAQQSLFDETRAPPDGHTVWAYSHVPAGSTANMTEPMLAQIERFAPGFRARIRAVATMSPGDLERYNPNYVGGDIAGGGHGGTQLFARPVARLDPYATPAEGLFLCSSSTPPGAGVHGMCGYYAARSALKYLATSRASRTT